MTENEYKRLVFSIDLLSDRTKENIARFSALSEEEQGRITNARWEVEQKLADKFTESDRKSIGEKFSKALKKAAPESIPNIESEREIFIRMIVSWVVDALDICARERQLQDDRKEVANSFINAISKAVDSMSALDYAALGYLLAAGFEQVETDSPGEEVPCAWKGNVYAFMELAYGLKTTHSDWLRSFHAGMAVALRKLPQVSKEMTTPQFVIAAAIEDYLGRLNVPFTTTETGLAGTVLHEVMAMADIEMGKAGYWLDKAKKHENSWSSFIARMKQKQQS